MTGNWNAHTIGDNAAGNNALSETGTFNKANEWTGRTRTTPSASPTGDTLTYDAVGNMTNDGKGQKYVYDGFGRLREVRLTAESNRIKSAYRYNGSGMRISHAINTSTGTTDDDVTDSTDPVTWFALDERWRTVAAYSGAGNSAVGATQLERWVHHAAGVGGHGSSSYIDSVILRDRDIVTTGAGASNPDDSADALEGRVYVLQNWRADVVATTGRTGNLIEWIQYTAYGSAITNPPGNGDFNGDGGVDGADQDAFYAAWTAGLLSADVNNDASVDGSDVSTFNSIWETGESPAAGLCVTTGIRIGYAGYQWDGSVNNGSDTTTFGERNYTGAMAGLYHVRHRVYDPELGRWTRRDPIGYVDGMGLYEYVGGIAVSARDASGLIAVRCDDRYNPFCTCGIEVFQNPKLGGHRWAELGDGNGVGYYPVTNGSCWYTSDPDPRFTWPGLPVRHCKLPAGDPATGLRPATLYPVKRHNRATECFGWFPGGRPHCITTDKKLEYGIASGSSCVNAGCKKIRDCLNKFVPSGPWNLPCYNCRDAINDALSSCCLSYA